MIKEYFKISIKNARKKKLRSWLTMIGIFVSIAVIFLLISLSLGLSMMVEEQFASLGVDQFFIMPKGTVPGSSLGATMLTEKDIEIINRVSGVKQVTYWTAASAAVEHREQTRYVLAAGMPYDKMDLLQGLSSFEVDKGSFPGSNERKKIIVGSQYALDTFFTRAVEVGDTLEINGERFRVGAILKPTGSPPDDRQIYMEINEFRRVFEIPERIDQIWIQVDDERNPREVSERVETRLRQSRGLTEKTQDFSVLTPEDLLRSFQNILNILTGFLVGIAAISLLVGSIGIANTMYTSVLERTREIGVMKAVGARNSSILTLFIIESGYLGLIGGIIGIGIGMALGKLIEYIAFMYLGGNLLQVAFPVWLIIGCIVFSFFIGAVSGALPAYRASKIKPTVALRYE